MTATARPRRRRSRARRSEAVAGYLFIAPWIIGLVVFTVISMSWSLLLSFQHYDLSTNVGSPAGFENYRLLFDDPRVGTALRNTFVYALLAVPLEILLALVLALLLHGVRRGSGLFRTIYYLPKMTPGVATASVFLLLLNGNRGAVNQALRAIGVDGPQWLTDPAWVKPSIVLMGLWSVGGAMVILLAALQGVPREMLEAAAVDGAGPWTRFFSVLLPMISPALFFLVIVNTIAALQVFDQAFLLFYRDTGSSAPDAALFYGVYLYQQAFERFDFGMASAMAWLLFLIIVVISVIQVRVGNKLVFYEGDER